MQTYSSVVTQNEKFGETLFDSPHAEEVKKRVKAADPQEVENGFSELLKQITDHELREKIDTAAGRIAYAYEKRGFVEGYLSELAYGCII